MGSNQAAFDTGDSTSLKTVFEKDELLGQHRLKAMDAISEYIKRSPQNAQNGLYLFSIVMKLERMGDQMKNIAKEIIFYQEATLNKGARKNTSVR